MHVLSSLFADSISFVCTFQWLCALLGRLLACALRQLCWAQVLGFQGRLLKELLKEMCSASPLLVHGLKFAVPGSVAVWAAALPKIAAPSVQVWRLQAPF